MISVTILTKNSQRYLPEVLEALKNFDEVLIYDNGSTDETLEIARRFPNVTVHLGPFLGFGPTHNAASQLARNDWILSIDSDEVVTPAMAREIEGLKPDAQCVYTFPRHNYFQDKWIKWCGWYPDRQKKLYHRNSTSFDNAEVHEAIISEHLKVIPLEGPLLHYSYASINDFLTKMQAYSTLFAQQNQGKIKSSPYKALLHGCYTFFKSYILKRGILGGYEGFVISAYMAQTAFYKYLKLYEMNKRHFKF